MQTLLSYRFHNEERLIELIAVCHRNMLLLFLYCNPLSTPLFFHQTLAHTLSQLQWNEALLCFGDFNNTCDNNNLLYFRENYNMQLCSTLTPFHKHGNYLDKALSTCPLQLHVRPTYWSDHSTVWCSIQIDNITM